MNRSPRQGGWIVTLCVFACVCGGVMAGESPSGGRVVTTGAAFSRPVGTGSDVFFVATSIRPVPVALLGPTHSVLFAQAEGSPVADEDIHQTIDDLLQTDAFRKLARDNDPNANRWSDESQWPKWLKDIFDWLSKGDDSPSQPMSNSNLDFLGVLAQIAYYMVIFAVMTVVGFLLFKLFQTWRPQWSEESLAELADEEAIQPTRPPGDLPTNEYERRAVLAAEQGDYRTGLRELVLGSMSWAERSGRIRYRKGRTNRDYVRAVWTDVPRRGSILTIIDAFEHVFYGHRPATEERFASSLAAFRESFAADPTTSTGTVNGEPASDESGVVVASEPSTTDGPPSVERGPAGGDA